jgi:hypothetical protein
MKNLFLIVTLFFSIGAAVENINPKNDSQYARYKKDDCGCRKP